MATGTANLTFGTVGVRQATTSVDVTTSTGLTSASYLEAFVMVESTADHVKDVARVDPIDLACEYLTVTSFRVYGTVRRGVTYGVRKIRWVTA